MMPRDKKNNRLGVDELKAFIKFAKPYKFMSSAEGQLVCRVSEWAQAELERRESAGKNGGRPKKEKREAEPSPELMKAFDVLLPTSNPEKSYFQSWPETIERIDLVPNDNGESDTEFVEVKREVVPIDET